MEMEFTDAEIREELARLGYKDVPDDKLAEFKKDLMKLIYAERSKSNSLNSSTDELQAETKVHSRPRTDSEFVKGNFTNHGNQWLRNNYTENYSWRTGIENWRSERPGREPISSATVTRSGLRTEFPNTYSVEDFPSNSEAYRHNYMRDDSSDDEAQQKLVKRKTSRKKANGEVFVAESFNSSDVSDTADVVDIYKKVQKMAMRDCECGKTRTTTSDTEPPYRLNGMNITPSVIVAARSADHPHFRNVKRCCPFKRMQMYQKCWKAQPAIGDNNHNRVRKEVHARMLAKDDIQTYHKKFVPNPYVVPTDKPRYDLRWAVRKANSNYEMPPHGFYHEV